MFRQRHTLVLTMPKNVPTMFQLWLNYDLTMSWQFSNFPIISVFLNYGSTMFQLRFNYD